MTEQEAALRVQSVVENCAGKLASEWPSLDKAELIGESWLHALDAIRSWDGRGTLEGWVGFVVSKALRGSVRSHLWCWRLHKPEGYELADIAARPTFSLERFAGELSSEAQRAIKIALSCGSKRKTIARLLRLKWFRSSIEEVFEEIRNALV